MSKKLNNSGIQWVFFDIGDVIVNEDKLWFNIYQQLQRFLRVHGISLTFDEILACREDLILGHADETPHLTIAKMYLSNTDYQKLHRELHQYYRERLSRDLILIPGMEDMLRQLSGQYALGLIADAPKEMLDFLRRKRLLGLFKIQAVSCVLKVSQPRKKIFEWAVNQAACSFENTVMVGDRIDQDILPARRLDMLTVQTLWNLSEKGYNPKARKPQQYMDSLARIQTWQIKPGNSAESADMAVTRVKDLPQAIQRLQ